VEKKNYHGELRVMRKLSTEREWRAELLIETFAEMFRTQVFSTDVDKGVVDEALSMTHNQSRKVRACLQIM